MIRTIPLIAALLTLTGCQPYVIASLYTSDVNAVASGGAPVHTPAKIGIEVISEQDCNDHRASLTNAIRAGFGQAKYIGCPRRDFVSYAEFEVPMALIGPAENLPAAIAFTARPLDDGIAVYVLRSARHVDAIRNALPRELTLGQPKDPEIRIMASVTNDSGGPVKVVTRDLFVNATPTQAPTIHTLDRRAELRLRLSDVGNAQMSSDTGYALMFRLRSN